MNAALKAAGPRVRFESVTRDVTDALPRMDVAVFVGFAATGPLHVPVAVEDINQFSQIFGYNPELAWDAEGGITLQANLGPAVSAFFANGGNRCWVIRVASRQATYNYYPLPCLLKCVSTSQEPVSQTPAFARARSEGSWSDSNKIFTALRTRPLPVTAYSFATSVLTIDQGLVASAAFLPESGSLVHLRFGAAGAPQFWLYAQAVVLPTDPALPAFKQFHLTNPHWFADAPADPLGEFPLVVQVDSYSAADATRPYRYFQTEDPYAEPESTRMQVTLDAQLRRTAAGQPYLRIGLDQPGSEKIIPGVLIRVRVGEQVAWYAVSERHVRVKNPASEPAEWVVDLDGQLFWPRDNILPPIDSGVLQAGVALSFDLECRHATLGTHRMQDIALTSDHPRSWGELPVDQGRYRPRPGIAPDTLGSEARMLAFPLASADVPRPDDNLMYIPLGMSSAMTGPLHSVAQTPTALERDGLASYDAALFLDPDLMDVSTRSLMGEADELRYLAPLPRPLCGIHAAFGFGELRILEEATLIAVPDAVHPGWDKNDAVMATVTSRPADGTVETSTDDFQACSIPLLDAPVLQGALSPTDNAYITLEWTSHPDLDYLVQESSTTDFVFPVNVYNGRGHKIDINRPGEGRRCFRVRAQSGTRTSGWSNSIVVQLPPVVAYTARAALAYQSLALKAVHQGLLRMACAQGELFAVLSLPRHYREQEMRDHYNQLAATFAHDTTPSPLSYGALYHPWLHCRDVRDGVITEPPDGAVLGVYAARAAQRGAWLAPANQRYATTLALTPAINSVDDIPINAIINTPEGFMCWSADTLEGIDPDLRLINVRRLLILLRRLALRHGAGYAFEPNGGVLRRLVQRRFEALLRRLYDRGAFAGERPEQAFQVDTGADLNTIQSVDRGRLIVALRVRPSVPMEFITLRLMQQGDQLRVAEGR
jgi:hypothetical protein